MNRLALVILAVLALAAVAGVFFVIRPFMTPVTRLTATPLPAAFPAARPYEEIMERTLASYNKRDATTLFTDFASTAVPAATPEVYHALFEGYYHEKFGPCLTRKLSVQETQILPDRALLVWDAVFSQAPRSKLSANFIIENGQPRIVQVRIEQAETEK